MTATETTVTMSPLAEKTGYWRVILLLLLGCNYAIVSINHTLPTFQGYTPHYFCQVDSVSPTIQGCVKELNASVEETEPSCPQGYQFESDRGDWTVATEWQLVCERHALRPLVATLYFCGVTLGAVVCGILADHFGRRPLVLVTLYAQGVLGVCLYFANSLEIFMAIRFVQGFFIQGLQGTTYALLVELFPPRLRTAVGVVLELYWALGLIILAGASYFVPNWRNVELVLSIPTALTLLYVCLIPESARWLATRGQHREAQRVWSRILPHKKKQFSFEASVRKNLILNEITSSEVEIKSIANARTQSNVGDSDIKKHKTDDHNPCIKGDSTICDEGESDSDTKRMSLNHEQNENHTPNNEECERSESSQIQHSSKESDSGITDASLFASNDTLVNSSEDLNNIDVENGNEIKVEHPSSEKVKSSIVESLQTDARNIISNLDNNAVQNYSIENTDTGRSEVVKIHKTERTKEIPNVVPADEDVNESVLVPTSRIFTLSSKLGATDTDSINCANESRKCSVVLKMAENCGSNRTQVSDVKKSGFMELFRNGVLRKYNLIMVYVWFSTSLSYYGIMFYLPDLSGERHLNFLLGAILEALSYMFAYVILSRYGRRLPMTSYLCISGFICIIVGAVSVVPEEDVLWIGHAQTALALLGKAAVVSAFCTMFLYLSELFPTVLRAAAMGHCGFWGRVGSLLAPQLLLLGEYTLSAVPLIIMGILDLLAGFLVLALPETLGQQLPDTVGEAEVLAKHKRQV